MPTFAERYRAAEETFKCGHHNYGTSENPASVFIDCTVCSQFYCESCNYNQHICHFCGDDLRHDDTLSNGALNPCYNEDN